MYYVHVLCEKHRINPACENPCDLISEFNELSHRVCFYSTPGIFHVPKFIMVFAIPISQVCYTFREFFKAKIIASS